MMMQMQGSSGPGRHPIARRKRRLSVASSASTYLAWMGERAMNRYGQTARAHWERHAPSKIAALEDPESFFTDLGEQIEAQVQIIALELERSTPEAAGYLDRVAQLTGFRRQAEEQVLAELVFSVEHEPASMSEELEEMLGGLPSVWSLDRLISDLEDLEEESGLTGEQATLLSRYRELLALIDFPVGEPTEAVEAMTEAEQRDLVIALSPFWDPQAKALRDL